MKLIFTNFQNFNFLKYKFEWKSFFEFLKNTKKYNYKI